MSSAGESILNLGLSFSGLGQLFKATAGLNTLTGIAQNSVVTINTFHKKYDLMAVKVTANSDKVIGMFQKISTNVSNGLGNLGNAVNAVLPSLGQRLMPYLDRGQATVEKFSKKLGGIKKGIHVFADLGTATFDVVGSFEKVKEALPAVFQLFQDPKALLNPGAWVNSLGSAVNSFHKKYDLMAVKVTANSDKVIGMFQKISTSVSNGLGNLGNAVNAVLPSLGQRLMPYLDRGQASVEKFSKKLGGIKKGIHVFADLGTATFDVIGSFEKVKEALPAAFQLFQDPKALLNPDAWVNSLGPVANSFGVLTRNSGTFLETFSNIPGIDKFGQKLGALGKNVLPSLKTGLTSVIGAVWSFTAALLANPVTWIVVGVIALGAALFLLWKNWDKVVNWFKTGFQWLVNIWGTITGFFANLWQQIVDPIVVWVKSIFDWIFNAGKAVFDFIGGLFGGGKKKKSDQTAQPQPLIKANSSTTIPNQNIRTNPVATPQIRGAQTNFANDQQAVVQLTQPQNNQDQHNRITKVDKIEINLNGGKNDQQTAKIVRNELLNIFSQQGAATVGG